MMKKIIIALFLSIVTCWAEGRASITTLSFPYGGEHMALGEAGAAYPSGNSSVFYNPALAGFIGKELKTQVLLSRGYSKLIPVLEIDDLKQFTKSIGFYAYDLLEDIDFGILLSTNKVEGLDGPMYAYSQYPLDFGTDENISIYTLGVGYKNIVGIGFSYKRYLSELGYEDIETTGGALDLGLFLQYPFQINEKLAIKPALGISYQNIGDSTYYVTEEKKDPIPKLSRSGISFDLTYGTILGITHLLDFRKDLIEYEFEEVEDTIVISGGQKIQITPLFAFNHGFMNDKNWKRKEYRYGISLGSSSYKMQDWLNSLSQEEHGYDKYPEKSKYNFYLKYDINRIHSMHPDNDLHKGQTFHEVSAGISFYPTKKRKNASWEQVQQKQNVEEFEGELVQ